MSDQRFSLIHCQPLTNLLGSALVLLATSAMTLAQSETVIYHFKGGSDGSQPLATMVADSAGNLYGTTVQGGASTNCDAQPIHFGCGTVFKLTRPTAVGSPWIESVLYTFTRGSDGGYPAGGVIFDQAGNLYGTTAAGGSTGGGTVFQLSPPSQSGAWTETTLYNFAGPSNGAFGPPNYLAFDKWGSLYGYDAGEFGFGGVFQLTPPVPQGGTWSYSHVHSFNGTTDGWAPSGGLAVDSAGNLYGTTRNGGNQACNGGCGVVFKMKHPATADGAWTESVLYTFQGMPDGAFPRNGVRLDRSGNFYGTTSEGGQFGALYGGYGTVFELIRPTQAGDPWTEAELYAFQNTSDGGGPSAGVTRDNSGNLFGTASNEVFELSVPPNQNGAWTETTLVNFNPAGLGEVWAGLTYSRSHADLYGTTQGGGICNAHYCNGVVYAVHP